MIAFLYARVSTGDQNEAMQLAEMQEFARRRGWDIETFADAGWSGAKERRPALDQMMSQVRKRKCDVVLVYKFDRFARSLRFLLNALAEFDALGVAFVSLHDNIDTTTPAGRLMFQIVGAFGEFERALIAQRVKSGMAQARADGKRIGRPRHKADVDRITQLRAGGHSLRSIAKTVGIGEASVRRALAAAPKG